MLVACPNWLARVYFYPVILFANETSIITGLILPIWVVILSEVKRVNSIHLVHYVSKDFGYCCASAN